MQYINSISPQFPGCPKHSCNCAAPAGKPLALFFEFQNALRIKSFELVEKG
jgi:hypothetical protein